MDEDYDVIVLGTGLKECILSGLISQDGNKVLHMDRNSYYGGESASLNLEQLYKQFRNGQEAKQGLGRSNDYCVDLCPKMIMASGILVKILTKTKVTKYLEFRSVAGSYVFKDKKVHKVPSTASEALSSSLMGFFQKRRFRNFVQFVDRYDPKNPKTHDGVDPSKTTCEQLYSKFKLDANTQAFTGHALALYTNDDYLKRACGELMRRCNLYSRSMQRWGSSPYIYPVWGLGGLPEGFARMSAVHSGVYMLHSPIEKILYDDDGHVTGIECKGEQARCKRLIADPSYFVGTDKVKKVGKIARCICIMNHPLPNTNDADSVQVIVPAKHTGRKNDIYVSVISYHHNVAPKGKYIAVASAICEKKEQPKPTDELGPALRLLGKVEEVFYWVSDYYKPVNDPSKDGCYITQSYDATTHWETSTKEVLNVYRMFTGKPLDLSPPKPENPEGKENNNE